MARCALLPLLQYSDAFIKSVYREWQLYCGIEYSTTDALVGGRGGSAAARGERPA